MLREIKRKIKDALGNSDAVNTSVEVRANSNVVDNSATLRTLYLDLVKRTLTDLIYDNVDPECRREGKDWPSRGYTMIGSKRLNNLQECIEDVLDKKVPGDLIETGVWRGGSTIFMRACLKAHGVTDRRVWVADSFEGLPKPNSELYPADLGDEHYTVKELAISLEQVKSHFQKFDLLDDQVCFLKGWFRDTLPTAPIKSLAILRLDGDLYESTMDAMNNLYPKLGTGGFLIVDDYGAIPACKKAIDDFRQAHSIQEQMHWIDWTGVYWQRKAN